MQASCILSYPDPQNNLKKHQNQTKLHLDDATVFLQSLYRLYSVNKVLEPATLQELFFFVNLFHLIDTVFMIEFLKRLEAK